MSLLNSYIEKRTKFHLTENQKKVLQELSEGQPVELVQTGVWERAFKVPTWQLDLFETLVRDFLSLEKKKEKIISDIEHQKIDQKEESISKIRKIIDLKALEDERRFFQRRKKTKATLAREAGLSEFSDWIWDVGVGALDLEGSESLEVRAKNYISPALGFVTYGIVLKGVQDIIVDRWGKISRIRKKLSQLYSKKSFVRVEKTDRFEEKGRYSNTVGFKEPLSALFDPKNFYKFPPIRKAWEEGQIKVFFDVNSSEVIEEIKTSFLKSKSVNVCTEFLAQALQKAVETHIVPSITQEILEDLVRISENEAIRRLKIDYQKTLMSPSFGSKPVMSIFQKKPQEFDVALVTGLGELVSTTSVTLTDKSAHQDFLGLIKEITKQISLEAIGIGLNEHARTAESFIRQVMELTQPKVTIPIVFINSRGLDSFVNKAFSEDSTRTKTEHSLLSLARRLQDPLFELCKYAPRNLLDVPYYVTDERLQLELKKVLGLNICNVGVDVNAVSKEALYCVPHLNKGVVKELIRFRTENSRFVEKIQLRTQLSLSEDDFSVASRFLKVGIAKSLVDRSRISGKDIIGVKDMIREMGIPANWNEALEKKIKDSKWKDIFGEQKLSFFLSELKDPFREPRKVYKVFGFSKNLQTKKDLKIGSVYSALVVRFSNFGAFVNLGINQDGLVHLSELSRDYISDPRKSVSLGQWLYVKVIDLKDDAKLIFLSKIQAEKERKNLGAKSKGVRSKGANSKNVKLKRDSRNFSSHNVESSSKGSQVSSESNNKSNNKSKNFKNESKSSLARNAATPKSGSRSGKSFKGQEKKGRKPPSHKPARTPFNNQFAVLSNLNIKNRE